MQSVCQENMLKYPKPFKFKRRPVFALFKAVIMRMFYHKPNIELLNEISQPCIFVSNHDAKRGPVMAELYLPVRTAKWGAYQMLCDYNTRRIYLRDVFYIKKQNFGRVIASLKAFFEAFFSLFIYRGMNFLPTYPDTRIAGTIRQSVDLLEQGMSILIFPEDSEGGYKEEIGKFFPGFVLLAESYYRKTGKDIPVYPIYYHSGNKRMVIGNPRYVHQLKLDGKNRDEIADILCNDVNNLFENYIKQL